MSRWSSPSARDGIRDDAVAAGPVWTPLIPATMPLDKEQVDVVGAQLLQTPAQGRDRLVIAVPVVGGLAS